MADRRFKITPLKDWTINVDYTYNMYILSKKQHGKEILEHTANPDIVTVFPHTTPSGVKFTTDDNYYQTFNAYTDYSKSLGKHNIKLLLDIITKPRATAGSMPNART